MGANQCHQPSPVQFSPAPAPAPVPVSRLPGEAKSIPQWKFLPTLVQYEAKMNSFLVTKALAGIIEGTGADDIVKKLKLQSLWYCQSFLSKIDKTQDIFELGADFKAFQASKCFEEFVARLKSHQSKLRQQTEFDDAYTSLNEDKKLITLRLGSSSPKKFSLLMFEFNLELTTAIMGRYYEDSTKFDAALLALYSWDPLWSHLTRAKKNPYVIQWWSAYKEQRDRLFGVYYEDLLNFEQIMERMKFIHPNDAERFIKQSWPKFQKQVERVKNHYVPEPVGPDQISLGIPAADLDPTHSNRLNIKIRSVNSGASSARVNTGEAL